MSGLDMRVSDGEVTSISFGLAAPVCAALLRERQNNSKERAELSLHTL